MSVALQAEGHARSAPQDEEAVVAIVRSVIAEQLRCPVADVPTDAKLESQLDIDSMAMIEINVSLEERFGIAMPDMAVVNDVKTVRDLARFIRAHIAKEQR